MKIKKKIDVEIEIDVNNTKECGYICKYKALEGTKFMNYCIMFEKQIKNNQRCQQCIEAFGE